MRDKLATFSLFFPEPLSAQDRANFEMSRVKRVQLFLQVARNNPILPDQDGIEEAKRARLLEYLHSQGASVTLRIEEPDPGHSAASYYNESNHAGIVADFAYVNERVPVEAGVVGNEPQGFHSQQRGSPNWGNNPEPEFPQGRAYAHQYAVGKLRRLLKAAGYKVVAPGWKRGRVRPQQQPQPGNATWARICTDEYNACDACGAHVYEDAMQGGVDDERYLWAMGEELERIHTKAWINEGNINSPSATQVQHMEACLRMYDLLYRQAWTAGVIESFCPFVSNGQPGQEWSHQIMREAECYRILGEWMGRPAGVTAIDAAIS